MSKTKTTTSPPLTDEEVADIKEFYANKRDQKVRSLDELLAELHDD